MQLIERNRKKLTFSWLQKSYNLSVTEKDVNWFSDLTQRQAFPFGFAYSLLHAPMASLGGDSLGNAGAVGPVR